MKNGLGVMLDDALAALGAIVFIVATHAIMSVGK